MKLNTVKFGLASAGAFAILWLLCCLSVWLMPSIMMTISGHMIHIDLSHLVWNLTINGMLVGLIGWIVSAGVAGMLVAMIYNQLVECSESD